MTGVPPVRQRRHTQYFLESIRSFSPVFLDTDVDMTRIREARSAGPRYSQVAYIAHAAGRALAQYPEANATLGGGLRPRLVRHEHVAAKITVDATLSGQRIVLATVVPEVDTASVEDIHALIAPFRDADPETMPQFAALRTLHRLPRAVGYPLFRAAFRSPVRRAQMFGTLAITSLGHRPVNGFHSVGGTTVTLGLGQTAERPVVRAGQLAVAPVMRLNLAFDHRVIDGALAADVLTAIKDNLEGFVLGPAAAAGAARADAAAG